MGRIRYRKQLDKQRKDARIRSKNANIEEKVKRGGLCQICGYDENLTALVWHHIRDKKYGIGELLARAALNMFRKEVKKCILICADCHMILHFGEEEREERQWQDQ